MEYPTYIKYVTLNPNMLDPPPQGFPFVRVCYIFVDTPTYNYVPILQPLF